MNVIILIIKIIEKIIAKRIMECNLMLLDFLL